MHSKGFQQPHLPPATTPTTGLKLPLHPAPKQILLSCLPRRLVRRSFNDLSSEAPFGAKDGRRIHPAGCLAVAGLPRHSAAMTGTAT
jgi:hypothetical protein